MVRRKRHGEAKQRSERANPPRCDATESVVPGSGPLTLLERDWLISQYYLARYPRCEMYLEEYYRRLPRMTLSRCPFTGEPLVRAFDPWGMDGFWWQHDKLRIIDEPAAPNTFQLLQGAVSLNGFPPRGGKGEAVIGPDAPFVIPRIMSREGMVAVISSIAMENGYTAYPIVYYSETKPEPGSLTQGWREQTYSYVDSAGSNSWRIDAHPWDFRLGPWVQSRRVRWIDPGDPQLVVQSGYWSDFPYKDLSARRERQTLIEDRLLLSPPPNGEEFRPFE